MLTVSKHLEALTTMYKNPIGAHKDDAHKALQDLGLQK